MNCSFRELKSTLVCLVALSSVGAALADPTLRLQTTQRGDFILIGNTLGYDDDPSPPAPLVGMLGNLGSNLGDTSPDVFWRVTGANGALADVATPPSAASSQAQLTLPDGAEVTHAFLIWGAYVGTTNAAAFDGTVSLARPGVFSNAVTAATTFAYTASKPSYQSIADVTALVQNHRSGPYLVSGVGTLDFRNVGASDPFAGWSMIVFYRNPVDPPRNLALFAGLDLLEGSTSIVTTLAGFQTPSNTFTARLGLVTYEGDTAIAGDQFFFGPAPALSDASNPSNNFFNGSRSALGAPESRAGDLPRLEGGPGTMAGMDLDVVDVSAKLAAGQTSVVITASTSGDGYFLGAFVTSIETVRPDFSGSVKSVADVNGAPVRVGDTVRYTIAARNRGNDMATNCYLIDPLPLGVAYVPDSMAVVSGPGTGPLTDPAGDDAAEYDAGSRSIRVRFGTGAGPVLGGVLLPTETVAIQFDVEIAPDPPAAITNQATVYATGSRGEPEAAFLTGNGSSVVEPTLLIVTTNQAPTVTAAGPLTVPAGGSLMFGGSAALTVSDPDAETNAIDLTLSVPAGSGALAWPAHPGVVPLSATSGASVGGRGPVDQLNASLTQLRFMPAPGVSNATVQLTAVADDRGFSGFGGAQVRTVSFPIAVTAPSGGTSGGAATGGTTGTDSGGGVTAGGGAGETLTVAATIAPASRCPGFPGRFTISRGVVAPNATYVEFDLGGSASNGVDYVATPQSAIIPANNSTVDVLIQGLLTSATAGVQNVTLTLRDRGTYAVGDPGSADLLLIKSAQNDFNNDCFPDLVWRKRRDFGFFGMRGAELINDSGVVLAKRKGRFVGISDVNRDGSPDVLFQRRAVLEATLMNGLEPLDVIKIATVPGGFRCRSVTELGGTSDKDIVLQRAGVVRFLLLDGVEMTEIVRTTQRYSVLVTASGEFDGRNGSDIIKVVGRQIRLRPNDGANAYPPPFRVIGRLEPRHRVVASGFYGGALGRVDLVVQRRREVRVMQHDGDDAFLETATMFEADPRVRVVGPK